MLKVFSFIKKEAVFFIALLCAIVSSFFVPPSKEYFSYIDWNTIFILFALMAVIKAFVNCNLFDFIGNSLSFHFRTYRSLSAVLIFLCFFSSMFITNDVALLTFVPLTLALSAGLFPMWCTSYVVVLETVAANTGSMFTPLGNPQNLFLFQNLQIPLKDFLFITFPYTLLSFILLCIALLFIPKKLIMREISSGIKPASPLLKGEDGALHSESTLSSPKNMTPFSYVVRLIFCMLLFILCVLSVLHFIPKVIAALVTLIVLMIVDRKALKQVDYMLLLTFCAFFIFTGNISNIPVISQKLSSLVSEREFFSSVLISQVISNVPATLLLYPFSSNLKSLAVGVNVGGLGSLVASLASLISFKLYMALDVNKRWGSIKYLLLFTLCNIIFLLCMVLVRFLILHL